MEKQEIIHLIDQNASKAEKIIDQKVDIWSSYTLFSDLWWMGVALTVVPWILWFFYRKKESTDRLLYIGFYVMVFSLTLDVLGDQFGLWHYRFNVIPVLPTYFPWDITLMPLTIMVLLQVRPKSNPYLKAILFALGSSYIAEPFFAWLQVYNPIRWNYSYSVPIQFIIFLTAHYLSRRQKFSNLE